jgi:hypothetical protein
MSALAPKADIYGYHTDAMPPMPRIARWLSANQIEQPDATLRRVEFETRFYLLFLDYSPVSIKNHGPRETGCRSEFCVRK